MRRFSHTLAGSYTCVCGYNTLSEYTGSFVWMKPLRLGQIPLQGHYKSSKIMSLLWHPSFSAYACVRTDKPIFMLWGRDDRFLLQIPLTPDLTALPFVLQLWALHPHLTASTLAYTTTTVPWPASQSEACSTPWPGRHICCHLPVVSIFYTKGRQKFVQVGSLWEAQV